MEMGACELLCQLNSKGEEISTVLFSSDFSVQAGFLKCVGWVNGCTDCRSLFVMNLMSAETAGMLEIACRFFKNVEMKQPSLFKPIW